MQQKTKSREKKAKRELNGEQISSASEAMENIFFDDEDGSTMRYTSFGERVRKTKNLSSASEVMTFVRKLEEKFGARDFNGMIRGHGGLRAMLEVSSKEELRSYCMLLSTSKEEIVSLAGNGAKFINMSLVTALGAYSQYMRDAAQSGDLVSQEDLEKSDLAFAHLSDFSHFTSGRNFARKIFSPCGDASTSVQASASSETQTASI